MADDWMFHGGGKVQARQPKPGERLFEFVRASDRAPMSCELRFHGESYGWEIQFFERGEFLYGHGAFATRAGAMDWAQRERERLECAGRPPLEPGAPPKARKTITAAVRASG